MVHIPFGQELAAAGHSCSGDIVASAFRGRSLRKSEQSQSNPPYTAWVTAAHTIQEAVDAAQAGDTVLVADGVYATGQRTFSDGDPSRVVIDKSILVQSVNGPLVTTIKGSQVFDPFAIPPRATNGVRCVALAEHALLSGFTLTNGAAPHGGGVWAEATSAVVSNCVITGNLPVGENNGAGIYGAVQFTLKPAGLRFTSTRCSMLAVAGDRAQLKGQGTINGQGNFSFTLTAMHDQRKGRERSERLRVKICDDATGAVVYDNQAGTPDTATLGNTTIIRGNIMVRNR